MNLSNFSKDSGVKFVIVTRPDNPSIKSSWLKIVLKTDDLIKYIDELKWQNVGSIDKLHSQNFSYNNMLYYTYSSKQTFTSLYA